MEHYLQALVNTCSTREACVNLGLGSNSYSSLRSLCDTYGVSIPPTRPKPYAEVAQTRKRESIRIPAKRAAVGVERAVVLGDVHVPFHDERALSVALAVIEDLHPEVVYLNGDIIDFYAVSRFSKDPTRALGLQGEIDQTTDVLERIAAVSKKAKRVFVRGNHEARIGAYLCSRAPELSGLRALDLPSLLSLDRLGYDYIEGKGKEAYTRYGSILIGHFDRVNQYSAYSAKNLIDKHAASLVQGHTHRLGTHYRTYSNGRTVVGMEGGCLCDLDPEYVSDPDWQHGISIVTRVIDSDRFHAVQVPIVGYECVYESTRYSV